MKRLISVTMAVLLATSLFAGRWILEDQNRSSVTINVDSTGDSSNGGLITVATDTTEMQETGSDLKSLIGALIVEASSETARGFGLKDSAFMILQTYGLGFAPVTLDSRGQLGLPCTLWVNLATVGDTLFKRHLRWIVQVLDTSAADSLVDSITTENGKVIDPYTIHWELIGRD